MYETEPMERAAEVNGGLTRRSFFKGAALAGAVAAGAGVLAGCQPKTAESADVASEGNAGAASAGAAGRNVQDDSYTAYTTDFSAVFSPLDIAGVTIPNRICKSAAGSELLFLVREELTAAPMTYYENFAKGGVGMIWVEAGDVSRDGSGIFRPMGRDVDVEYWKPLVEALHSHGSKCGVQMEGTFQEMSSSKSIPSVLDQNGVSYPAMTTEQVKDMIAMFIDGAANIQKMGFDGVELNASCSHTYISFLSRYWNNERNDEYDGSSLENRARIVTEMIEGIRAACGEDFIIQVLYSPVEENLLDLGNNSACMKLEEGIAMAKLFEQAGASSLHVRSSMYGNHAAGFMQDLTHVPVPGHTSFGTVMDYSQHMDGMLNGQWDGTAGLLNIATEIKKNVSIPVGVVGCMDPRLAPDLVNNAIADGDVDFVLMTRPLLADPALPNKLKEGRHDEVAPCAHCLTCFDRTLDGSRNLYCRVNATITRAYDEDMPEGTDLVPAVESKNVMVIGGGPSGMEAARVAALRGHTVTLYEKSGSTGGKLSFAAAVKGPHEKIADHAAYLKRQLELASVEVVTGQEVDAAFVEEKAPDAVVVATGGRRTMIDIPGSDRAQVCSIQDYASQDFGDHVVVVGANLQAVDFAVYLMRDLGKKVTIVHDGTEEDISAGAPLYPRASNLAWIRAKGCQIYNESRLTEITDSSVTIVTSYGTEETIDADNVVSCINMLPDDSLAAALGDARQVIVVGDAMEPGTICHAIATGNIAARQIAPADVAFDPLAKMSGEFKLP